MTEPTETTVRVRMRPYWLPGIIVLCLAALFVLWLLRWSENRLYTESNGLAHLEQLEDSLHLLDHYEKEPPAVRWLSGIYSSRFLYREQDRMARHAERDGYLLPAARQMMCLFAQRAGDQEGVAYWRGIPAEGKAQGALPEENRKWLQEMKADYHPGIEEIVNSGGGEWMDGHGRLLYAKQLQRNGIDLAVLVLLFPAGWKVFQLLRGQRAGVLPLESPVTAAWRPGVIFGGWVWAIWIFGVSGMLFTALNYLSGLAGDHRLPWQTPDFLVRLAVSYGHSIGSFFYGPWGMVFTTLLFAGPGILLSRRFTGGVRGALEIFGLRPVRSRAREILVTAAGGVWLLSLWHFTTDPAFTWLGWFDPSDGWRYSGEMWYEFLYFAVILAPLAEEWIFRGVLYRGFSSRWSPWRAALLSSVLFALMHAYSLPATIDTAIAGILFCGLYQRTGTLWTPMIAHAASNLLLWTW